MSASTKYAKRRNLIWGRLVPESLLALLYIVDMSMDIAAATQLYSSGDYWGSYMCAFLIFLPVLVFCSYEAITRTVQHKCSCKHAGLLFVQLLFSPVIVLLRFGERIFWLVEAVSVTKASDRELAHRKAEEPRRIELYLFLRPILQGMPQCMLQMFLLIHLAKVEIRLIQVLSMLTSILSFSIIAANYQRFESQEESVMPWKYKELTQLTQADKELIENIEDVYHRNEQMLPLRPQTALYEETKVSAELNVPNNMNISQTLPRKFRYVNTNPAEKPLEDEVSVHTDNTESSKCTVPPRKVNETKNIIIRSNSPDIAKNGASTPPPVIPPRAAGHRFAPARPPSKHSTEETDKIQSSEETSARNSRVSFLRHSYTDSPGNSFRDNRRSSYHYLPVSIASGSSSNRSSDIKVISVPDFQAPPIPKTMNSLNVALPTRKKGTKYVDSDNPMSYFVTVLKWFLFVGSRTIAISGLFALCHNSLIIMLITLACFIIHVTVMFIIITVNSDQPKSCWWKSFILSLTSVFCLLEIGVKFKKYMRIMVIYWPLCFVENIVTAFIAFRPDQILDITDWWFAYLFYTTISTYILSVTCMLYIMHIMTPKTYVIYDE